MELRGLRTANHVVADMDGAKAWYSDLLGTKPYFDEPFYVGFDIGGYEFGLSPGEPGVGGSIFYWATEDPQTFVDTAAGKGATAREPVRDVGEGIILGSFVDPFGNEFGVIRNPHFAPQIVEASAEDVAESAITYDVTVPVTSYEAWALWATQDGVGKWWTENTIIDLRPGGQYEIHFMPDAAPGDKGGDWCRVLSFLPGQMLSFTWNAPPTLKTRPLHTWVVLMFEPVADGCRVTLNHLGWPASGMADSESERPATFEYFTSAWRQVIDLFESQFHKS